MNTRQQHSLLQQNQTTLLPLSGSNGSDEKVKASCPVEVKDFSRSLCPDGTGEKSPNLLGIHNERLVLFLIVLLWIVFVWLVFSALF
jgi:hypothetical protein